MNRPFPGRIIHACFVAVFLVSQGAAQATADPLVNLKASYEAAIFRTEKEYSDTKENCRKGYPAALNTREMLFKRAGNLDGVMAIRAEKERYTKEKTVPKDPPPGTDDQVKVLQASYHKALGNAELKHNKAILHWTRLYLDKLDTMEKSLTKAGKIDEALAIRREAERVRKDPVVKAAEFAMADIKAATAAPAAPATQTPPTPTVAAPAVSRCTACDGTGKCDRCNGSGVSPHALKGSHLSAKCLRCLGSGKCKACQGTGWVGADGKSAAPPAAHGEDGKRGEGRRHDG